MKISVCICTFRRPQQLAMLLHAIAAQSLAGIDAVQVVVVDNDPANSAGAFLRSFQMEPPFFLVALHMPQPNISVARNCAIEAAQGELIAFIDDDEVPVADWLVQLLNTLQTHMADVVFGPVLAVYRDSTPDWIRKGGYFERRRFLTGALIDEADARTGNVLLKASLLKNLKQPFETSFGRTGGEDSLLFRDLLAGDARFVWCDEATVSEEVPDDRASATWLLKRSFRIGQTWIRAELHRLSGLRRWQRGIYLAVKAGVQLLASVALTIAWLPLSRIQSFHWLRKTYAQAGKLTGMTAFHYQEYGG
jgi:succinoglycan biosynthesis protein ExoM